MSERKIAKIKSEITAAVINGEISKAQELGVELKKLIGDYFEVTVTYKTTIPLSCMVDPDDDIEEIFGRRPTNNRVMEHLKECAEDCGSMDALVLEWGFLDGLEDTERTISVKKVGSSSKPVSESF